MLCIIYSTVGRSMADISAEAPHLPLYVIDRMVSA